MNKDDVIKKINGILMNDDVMNEIIKNENFLFEIIPELKLCVCLDQKNIWHIYDVYFHILHVINNVDMDYELRYAALFHDLGKVYTFLEDENGVGHFPKHYKKSYEIFMDFSKKYNLDKEFEKNVSKLIYYHDLDLSNEENMSIIEREFSDYEIINLFKLKKADLLAQNHKFIDLLSEYDKQKEKLLSIKNGGIK